MRDTMQWQHMVEPFPLNDLSAEEEQNLLIPAHHRTLYVHLRNHVLCLWARNPKVALTYELVVPGTATRFSPLLQEVFRFLVNHGYINYGIITIQPVAFLPKVRVAVLGAGFAGIACALQLHRLGFDVTLFEAASDVGGCCRPIKNISDDVLELDPAPFHLQGHLGHPFAALIQQIGQRLLLFDADDCPIFDYATGRPVCASVDSAAHDLESEAFAASNWRKHPTGTVGEAYQKELSSRLGKAAPQMESILQWYKYNHEYSFGAPLESISTLEGRDELDIDGPNCALSCTLGALARALCTQLPGLRCNSRVVKVERGVGGCKVVLDSDSVPHTFAAVVSALPLGVLRAGAVEFTPSLPEAKTAAIQRLGVGNYFSMTFVFSTAFWESKIQSPLFGFARSRSLRQRFFLVWNMQAVKGIPVLMAILTDATDQSSLRQEFLELLGRTLEKDAPEPLLTHFANWRDDPLQRGTGSFLAEGSQSSDRVVLRENVGGQLFFAGEATDRRHPSSLLGAWNSGRRAAAAVAQVLGHHPATEERVSRVTRKRKRICGMPDADLSRAVRMAPDTVLLSSRDCTAFRLQS